MLVEYYSANALLNASSLAWSLGAVARCGALRSVAVTALGYFLSSVVADMRRRVSVYSGAGVRGDGNHDFAMRIGRCSICGRYVNRPYTVALGWCGIDGALLKPITSS